MSNIWLGLALGVALANAASIYRLLSSSWRKAELYEDDREAALLNLSPGPGTRWMNMGWWDLEAEDQSFAAAGERLTRRLWSAAGVGKGERICDVGFGSGESVRLLAHEFAPAKLVGVTSLKAQHARAVTLVAKTELDPSRVQLVAGDATSSLAQFGPDAVDVVLALDCAYHFTTRQSFLHAAHELLAPEGRIALTDLVLPSRALSWIEWLAIRAMYLAAGLPGDNLITGKEYIKRMEQLGYEDVQLEDISEHVWPGFCAFIDRREADLGGVLHPRHWGGLRKYARVVRWYANLEDGGKGRKLEFVMVTARKAANAS